MRLDFLIEMDMTESIIVGSDQVQIVLRNHDVLPDQRLTAGKLGLQDVTVADKNLWTSEAVVGCSKA
jgi:hypothetical protein